MITMVSPRHYLNATHMHPDGSRMAFFGSNNVVYWRRTLERVDIGNDTSVGLLDADLPADVGFLPVLPANFSDYLPGISTTPVPGVGLNQHLCLFSQPMAFGLDPVMVLWNAARRSPDGASTNWNYTLQIGDSSNPQMLLVQNQLVLVSHAYGVNAGPNYAFQIASINGRMRYLSTHNHAGSDYQLTQFSLTNWPALLPR